jgi:predicted acylesterase/phospholipase RssA
MAKQLKRAICLAGGGPAAGLHIGVLEGLEKCGITFNNKEDVWALSCIGAWVGVVYNQAASNKIEETKDFFRGVFRDDRSFESFPANTIFAPDWAGNVEAIWEFLLEPRNYKNAFVPREIMKSWLYTMSAIRRSASRRRRYRFSDREVEEVEEFREFSEGDFNRWTLNHVLAVNPAIRFLTALMYKSRVDGLSKLYYPDSTFLKKIDFKKLYEPNKPYLFHNAWNLSSQELRLFCNYMDRPYKPITAQSLCACSALPFIEQTVEIDGNIYCEGALVDTVNFKNLLEDHPDLDEIWISRIVDADQVRQPRNLHDSLANLCELFAAAVGEDDVKLFKYHVKFGEIETETNETKKAKQTKATKAWTGTIVEIPVDSNINFEWSRSNLDLGIKDGARAAIEAKKHYDAVLEEIKKTGQTGPIIIQAPDREKRMEKRKERLNRLLRERLIAAGRV